MQMAVPDSHSEKEAEPEGKALHELPKLCRIAGLTLRHKVRNSAGSLELDGFPFASKEVEVEECAGGITYPIWLGNASEPLRKSSKMWLVRRTSELPCSAYCHCGRDE